MSNQEDLNQSEVSDRVINNIGKEISLCGETVVIINDFAGKFENINESIQEEYIKIGDTEETTHGFYVKASELERLKKSYPSAKYYGFWQLFYANKVQAVGTRFIRISNAKDKDTSGIYAEQTVVDDQVVPVSTGMYINKSLLKHLTENFDHTIREHFYLSNISRLPSETALTLNEKSSHHKRQITTFIGACIGLCILIAASGFLLHTGLAWLHQKKVSEIETLISEKEQLEILVAEEQKVRLAKWPKNTSAVKYLIDAYLVDPKFLTYRGASSNFNSSILLQVDRTIIEEPSIAFSWVRKYRQMTSPHWALEVPVTHE